MLNNWSVPRMLQTKKELEERTHVEPFLSREDAIDLLDDLIACKKAMAAGVDDALKQRNENAELKQKLEETIRQRVNIGTVANSEIQRLNRLLTDNDKFTFAIYEDAITKTAIYPGQNTITGLVYCALGLGEVGELQGKVKKILRDDDGQIDNGKKIELVNELGDVLWYVASMARELGVSLSGVAQSNLEKLRDRQARGVLKGSGDQR